MQNLQLLASTLVTVYKDGAAALADGKLNTGEIFKLLLDAGSAAAVDFKALPGEWNDATTDDIFSIVKSAEAQLEGDANKDFIVGIIMFIVGAGKFKA